MTEVIGEHDAFLEQARREDAKRKEWFDRFIALPMVGGPLDGTKYAVPKALMRGNQPIELPVELPHVQTPLILPKQYKRYAVYGLNRAAGVLDYARTTTL